MLVGDSVLESRRGQRYSLVRGRSLLHADKGVVGVDLHAAKVKAV
jgi:hypothetical protein